MISLPTIFGPMDWDYSEMWILEFFEAPQSVGDEDAPDLQQQAPAEQVQGESGTTEQNRVVWLLPAIGKFEVGRVQSDITIANGDLSISRKHGVFIAKYKSATKRYELNYVDTSRLGSYVNKLKVDNGDTVQIQDGFTVEFGVSGSGVKVNRKECEIVTSNLQKDEKKLVYKLVRQMGCVYGAELSKNTNYLVMGEVTTTAKCKCRSLKLK